MVDQSDSPAERSPGVPTDRAYEWTRAIIDELPQFVFVKDATGTHVLANKAVADSHGVTVEQLEGTTDEQFVHEPSGRDYSEDDQSVLESGEPLVIPAERISDADGTERIVKSRLKRITGPDGDDQLLVVATDITEEKRREHTLEQQRDLLAKVERLGSTGGWELDAATDTVTWTGGTQQIFGVDDTELTLADALSYFHPTDRTAVKDAIQRCLETHEPFEVECRIVTATGEIRWVQTKGERVAEAANSPRLRGAINDITAQKRREYELKRQNDRLDEFASVVAHDLRNPLHTAQGYAKLAEETADLDHLSTVHAALDRMDAIVSDTLTLAREGQTVSELRSVTTTELATECWQLIERDDATLDCGEQLCFQGDPDRLQHVFENLFRNAVKHGGPTVTVSVGPLDSADGFYIEDDGPGIAPDERDSVFEPGHTTRPDGTGFGLAIVNRIADAHGWSVSLDESSTGGARFEFSGVDVQD